MAQLALEAALTDLIARLVIECGGMQRVGDPPEHRVAQLLALGAEQPASSVGQRIDRRALPLDAGAQRPRVAAAGEHVVLRRAQPVPRLEQLRDRAALRPHQLVYGPGRHRGLAQRRDLGRALALSRLAQLARERVRSGTNWSSGSP